MKKLLFFLGLVPFVGLAQVVPPPASVSEVQAGVSTFKYVSPYTLANGFTAGGQATNVHLQASGIATITTNGQANFTVNVPAASVGAVLSSNAVFARFATNILSGAGITNATLYSSGGAFALGSASGVLHGNGNGLTNLSNPAVIAGANVTVTTNTVSGTGNTTYTIATSAGSLPADPAFNAVLTNRNGGSAGWFPIASLPAGSGFWVQDTDDGNSWTNLYGDRIEDDRTSTFGNIILGGTGGTVTAPNAFILDDSTYYFGDISGATDAGEFNMNKGTIVGGLTNSALTADRVIFADANKRHTSSATTGLIRGTGVAATFSDVQTLAPGTILTNGHSVAVTFSNNVSIAPTRILTAETLWATNVFTPWTNRYAVYDNDGRLSVTNNGIGLTNVTSVTTTTATFGDDDTSTASTEFVTNARGGTNSWGSQTIDFTRGRNILTNMSANITITAVETGFSNNRVNEQYYDLNPNGATRVLTVPGEWFVSGFTNSTTVAITNGTWAEMCVTAIIGRRTNAVINFYQ